MNALTIYQCIPAYKPIPTARLIRSLAGTGCKILLDIEDSIQNVKNPELSSGMKAKSREDAHEIIGALPHITFSLRINSISGAEYIHDIELLKTISPNLKSVFLPKVETADVLNAFGEEFGDRFKLNIIIESQKGIDNLESILRSTFSHNIECIFFGNYDYHLDTGTYPITEQNHPRYWEIVKPIISVTELHNISFGNSPYTNIADTDCLSFAYSQLRNLCKRNFAMVSLHRTQTVWLQSCAFQSGAHTQTANNREIAAVTLDIFERRKLKGRSFAMDQNRIITPQEYLLLKGTANE